MVEMDQNQKDFYLGLDIGGTKCSVVAGDASFAIKHKIVFDTRNDLGYKSVLAEFQQHMKTILANYPDQHLEADRNKLWRPPGFPNGDDLFSPEFAGMG